MNKKIIREARDLPPGCVVVTIGNLGLIATLILCLCALISCNPKVTDINTDEQHILTGINTSTAVINDSTFSRIDLSSTKKTEQNLSEWWKAHITRTYYSTDSLGNQSVTMTEEIDIDLNKESDTKEEEKTDKEDTTITLVRDSVSSSGYTHQEDVIHEKKHTEQIPWYVKNIHSLMIIVILALICIGMRTYRLWRRKMPTQARAGMLTFCIYFYVLNCIKGNMLFDKG